LTQSITAAALLLAVRVRIVAAIFQSEII